MTVTRCEGNVIHADFRKPAVGSLSVQITNEVLYRDDTIMLVRTHLALNGASLGTTHFLAHKASERVEVIPVEHA